MQLARADQALVPYLVFLYFVLPLFHIAAVTLAVLLLDNTDWCLPCSGTDSALHEIFHVKLLGSKYSLSPFYSQVSRGAKRDSGTCSKSHRPSWWSPSLLNPEPMLLSTLPCSQTTWLLLLAEWCMNRLSQVLVGKRCLSSLGLGHWLAKGKLQVDRVEPARCLEASHCL